MKKITAVTATYNRAWSIERAIRSVLRQKYHNWELIIIDDGSTDNTREIIEKYLTDKRIRYYKFHNNRGVNYARNKGFDLAKGDYITILDSDDEFSDDAFDIIIEQFSKVNDAKIGGLNFYCRLSTGNPRLRSLKRRIHYTDVIKGVGFNTETRFVIKKEVLKNKKYRFVNLPGQFEDILWLRIAREYDYYLIPNFIQVYHTEHSDRLTGTGQMVAKAEYQCKLYDVFFKEFGDDYKKYNPAKFAHLQIEKALNEIISGYARKGRRSLREALNYNKKKIPIVLILYSLSYLPTSLFIVAAKKGHKFKKILR